MEQKQVELEALARHLAPQLRAGRLVVFTNGCFDLLHVGHTRYLRRARELGDLLVVAINSDRSIRRIKGESRPIQSEQDRSEILAALACVDYVTVFDDDTPLGAIELLQPDVLVKGGDWPLDAIVGRRVVEERGGRVTTIPYVSGMSTTSLIERTQQGNK